MENSIKTFKGMDKDMKCRGFQFEMGSEYEAEGEISVCNNGFHACERPLDVLIYYPPATSRYFAVEQSGDLSRDGDNSKVASRKIKIGAEIGIPGLVKAQIEYVKAHTTTEHTDPERATAGYRGAATAGKFGAATAGDYGAATSRGSVTVGKNGCGLVRGNNIKIRGGLGAILTICVEQNDIYDVQEWKSFVIDGETYKADTWYTLKNGEIVEVKDAD